MDQKTQTMMTTAIEENTGYPIEHWMEVVRKHGVAKNEDIITYLIDNHKINPLMAEFIATKVKGDDQN